MPPERKSDALHSACRCCSQDAVGFQTTVTAHMGPEEFSTSGLMVLQRNWLDVYRYTNWGGTSVPALQPGDKFVPKELMLRAGQTEPPPKQSERDLLALMDRYGIGTDATVSNHIATQQVRCLATQCVLHIRMPSRLHHHSR